jgi:hypothetical protein
MAYNKGDRQVSEDKGSNDFSLNFSDKELVKISERATLCDMKVEEYIKLKVLVDEQYFNNKRKLNEVTINMQKELDELTKKLKEERVLSREK